MRGVLRAGAQMEDGKKLGARVDDQPEHLFGAAQPGSQFIQLQVRELEMAEAALVQGWRVRARTGQKGWEWWPVESRRPAKPPKDRYSHTNW
jgi:hypothetical protein